jgi:hypothetical protein
VVAADDEVRAAVVLAADRVPDRLARARVAHGGRERGDDDPLRRVVALDEHVVGLHARGGRDVVRLRLPDEGMDEQTVDGLERALRQVLVGPVDRVPRLEADHPAPASLGEERARLGGILVQLGEARRRTLEDRDGTADVVVGLRVHPGNARMGVVPGEEAALGLAGLVVLVDLLDVEDGQRPAGFVRERDPVSLRRQLDGDADGQRPGQPARQMHVLEDAPVVLPAHEPPERRERPGGEHVEVGELPRGEPDRLEALDVLGPLAGALDELAAVRRNELGFGGEAHTLTSP